MRTTERNVPNPGPPLRPLAVVIPAYNAADDLARCLDSVHRTVPAETEVLVIDDASTDPAVRGLLQAWARRRPGWRRPP